MTSTYSKLNNGDWGIRVQDGTVTPGATVTVTKKDGTTKKETVEKVIWTGVMKGHGVSLCSIKPRGAREQARAAHPGEVKCRHCGEWTPEGDDWCFHCGRADYER